MTSDNKRVFLVEDDPAISELYKMFMEKSGFKVQVFGIGQDVIKALDNAQNKEDLRPDIVLLDLILPDMNGVDIVSHIRSDPAFATLKVFILTNQSGVSFDQNSAKPDKIVIKADTTPSQLVDLINEAFKK